MQRCATAVRDRFLAGVARQLGRPEGVRGKLVGAGRVALHRGTLVDLPLADAALDGLITVNTMYFVEEVEPAFTELLRVLRPGGRAVVGVGDPVAMASMPFTPHGFRLRPVEQVVEALRTAGFADVTDRRVGAGPRAYHLLVASRV